MTIKRPGPQLKNQYFGPGKERSVLNGRTGVIWTFVKGRWTVLEVFLTPSLGNIGKVTRDVNPSAKPHGFEYITSLKPNIRQLLITHFAKGRKVFAAMQKTNLQDQTTHHSVDKVESTPSCIGIEAFVMVLVDR